MEGDVLLYMGTLAAMVALFGALARRAFRKDLRGKVEEPKHRMLEE